MLRPTKYLFLTVITLLLAACGSSNNEPTPPPVPDTPVHRTVLVYIAADNSLGTARYDSADIREMRAAALNGDLQGGRLLVYHKGPDTAPTLSEMGTDGKLTVIKDYTADSLTSIHAQRMLSVIADARQTAPADQMGLVLWSHADGWLNNGIDDPYFGTQSKARSYGQEQGKRMSLTTLSKVLDAAGGFDFIYFDCCYMGTVEVAYQLRNVTPYIVASPTELPANGMPYDRNLRSLFKPAGADLVEAATNTFNTYNALYGQDRTCTMTVIRTDALEGLAAATARLYGDATTEMWPLGYYPQKFAYTGINYHYDMADYVRTMGASADPQMLADWESAFADAIMYEAHTPLLWDLMSLERCNGLSTYIPRNTDDLSTRGYNQLDWYTDVASAWLRQF